MARRPGKYAHVIGDLEKTFGTDGPYQDKVDLVKDEIAATGVDVNDIPALATQYLELRAVKDEAAAKLYDANLRLEAVEQLMSTLFDDKDIKHIQLGDQPLYYRREPYPQVEDKEAFRQWCMADPDLVRKMQLWPATMASLTKQRLIAGENPPPGVKVFSKPRFTRGPE